MTDELNKKGFKHVIIFRDRPIKCVEDTLLASNAEIKILKPTRSNIYIFMELYQILKEIRPNIVHFHFYPIYSSLNYLKFFFSIKIVYTDHMGSRELKTPFKKALRKLYYKTHSILFNCGIDKIVCVSNYIKLKYSKEYNIHSSKLLVIYNGVNLRKFQQNIDTTKLKEKLNIKDEFVVSTVGLRADKGVNCLIKAIPNIIKSMPNTKFILVGEGECRSYLERMVDNLKLNNYVVFTGNMVDISGIYQISSCVVVSSLVEEAFCFVAVEAMAAGTQVIAFDSGALREVLYDLDQLIPKNYTLLSQKIIKCLKTNNINNNVMMQYVGSNYSLDKCVYNYMQLYDEILKK
ncbi:glycosyltransferase family 4 protein [Methanococcoides burtonii]|nr:glycosyltransferase family 4 protein [Methanococcoides burtonii]